MSIRPPPPQETIEFTTPAARDGVPFPRLLAACTGATDWNVEREALARAPICCDRPDQFSFEPMPIGEEIEREIVLTSPAFTFGAEKIYFLAFELPRADVPLTLTVAADMLFKGFPRVYAMFYPLILFLNDRNEPVRTVSADQAAAHFQGFYPPLETVVQINPRAGWRYFVVYTTPESLKARKSVLIASGLSVSTMVPAGAGFVSIYWSYAGTTRADYPAVPVARIKVRSSPSSN